jgi:type I restriction enzyme, S subunit
MKNGWQSKRLSEVCEIIMGTSPPGDTYNTTGEGVPLINGPVEFSPGSFGKTVRSKFTTAPNKLCKENDLILCVRGSTTGKMNIAGFDACVGRGVAAIRAKEYQPWINHFISSKTEEIYRLGTGATFPNISSSALADLKLLIPPLPEQQRIVGILDEALDGIATAKANAENNLQNARALFESHLQAVFTQRSEGCAEHTLGDVCKFIGGSQPPKSVFSKTKTTDNVRLIQIRDYKSDKHLVHIPRSQARRFCKANDVMIGRYGPPLFQILRGLEGAYNVALMKAVPDETKLTRDYLFYFLKHSSVQQYVIFHSERAAGQSGLNKATLEPYPIALPSLSKQTEIVETIGELEGAVERLESIYQSKLDALEAFKKSLLHQAFSGQL